MRKELAEIRKTIGLFRKQIRKIEKQVDRMSGMDAVVRRQAGPADTSDHVLHQPSLPVNPAAEGLPPVQPQDQTADAPVDIMGPETEQSDTPASAVSG